MNLKSIGFGVAAVAVVIGGGVFASRTYLNTSASDAHSATSSSKASSSSSVAAKQGNDKEKEKAAAASSSAAASSTANEAKKDSATDTPASKTDKVAAPQTDPTPTAAETANKLRSPINWRLSSEDKPYPDVNKYPNLWIHVSIPQQRVFLMTGNTVLYTMYASTGMESVGAGTPRGTFHIQKERGLSFYNPTAQGGAYNWTSFKDHGVFLFHSVPIYENGQYILSEAAKLGKQEASHGCIRLSVPDAKWFHDNIKYDTKVVID
ncbi:L,D-transpeptidase [Periweissella fabalis]|uniref:L,D-transpeptidase n=1 Tax=Periweissella fabalis TaxID=1070421 RepID=A0A7X6N0Y8_9LACO|nr:L,D-transpeptidase [Periweissella fabalis]MCM0598280.1 L,D-transpeptidase [Periweissella fabalis]NKZ23786.1 L,D-transpeptidase [Periweissella fabalis]